MILTPVLGCMSVCPGLAMVGAKVSCIRNRLLGDGVRGWAWGCLKEEWA